MPTDDRGLPMVVFHPWDGTGPGPGEAGIRVERRRFAAILPR
ncbi:hypothetical protein [Streptomyces sp. NPDC004134]